MTDVGASRIDESKLGIYRIVITLFQVEEKDKMFYFFQKLFLLTDININVIFGMSFLTLSSVKV